MEQYKAHAKIVNIERRDAFFKLLLKPSIVIKELHIFSHSIGAGIFLGYGDQSLVQERAKVLAIAQKYGKRVSYQTVLDTEQGAILTDDLIRSPYNGYRDAIRHNFAAGAKIKIWGCNSAVPGWNYSDPVGRGATADPNEQADYFYWRALNEMNVPKPSVAQAFANYFQATTYGAGDGASIQVLYKGKWTGEKVFLKTTHRRFVNETDVLRLAPDTGDYNEYQPR